MPTSLAAQPTERPPCPPAPPRTAADAHRERLQPALREGLDVLVGRPTKGLDLAAELRRLLVTFNRALGAEAT